MSHLLKVASAILTLVLTQNSFAGEFAEGGTGDKVITASVLAAPESACTKLLDIRKHFFSWSSALSEFESKQDMMREDERLRILHSMLEESTQGLRSIQEEFGLLTYSPFVAVVDLYLKRYAAGKPATEALIIWALHQARQSTLEALTISGISRCEKDA